MVDKEGLHDSTYWCKQVEPDFWVIDPDGWDRKNLDESWNELITFDEFIKRCYTSTLAGNDLTKYF